MNPVKAKLIEDWRDWKIVICVKNCRAEILSATLLIA